MAEIALGAATVGLAGAGNIGSAVARGLLKSRLVRRVVVFDIDREKVRPLEALGAAWAGSAAALAASDVLITALPKPEHVRAVMEREGVLAGLRRGAAWVDHTSTEPAEARRLGDKAAARGVRMLEAPLTGGLELLQQGIMTVLVGDDENGALLAQLEPLLACYTSNRLLMGEVGKASVVKILTNMLCAVHTVASAEALAVATAAGINKEKFFDGVRASAGNSYVFETEVPLMFNGSFDPGFTLELHCKDLRIGDGIAARYGVRRDGTVLLRSTEIYEEATRKYGKDKGSTYPAKLIEQQNGLSFYTPGWDQWSYTAAPHDDGRNRTGLAVQHRLTARL